MIRQQAMPAPVKLTYLADVCKVLEVSEKHLTSREVGTDTFIYEQSFGEQVSSSLHPLQGEDPMKPMVNMQARASTPLELQHKLAS